MRAAIGRISGVPYRHGRRRVTGAAHVANVLVAEDNEINRDMLPRRLGRRGFQVVIASDGAEGVAKAKSELPP